MLIVFTGSREGMTPIQAESCRALLAHWMPAVVRHGDCIGSDEQFSALASSLDPRPRIIAHPGVPAVAQRGPRGRDKQIAAMHARFRANSPHNDDVLAEMPYLRRNDAMIDLLGSGDVLIGAPYKGQTSGGTWHTVQEATRKRKNVVIVRHDGSLEWRLQDSSLQVALPV